MSSGNWQLRQRPLAIQINPLSLIIEVCLSSSEFQLTAFFQQFPDNVLLYQPATVKISILNPLTEPLEKCVIVVGGQGLIYRQRKYR